MQNTNIVHNNKIFIIAGEVSGDILGASIMQHFQDVDFVGVGGKHMQDAGLRTVFPISDISVMGIIEVCAHLRTLSNRINLAVESIIQERPDIVLTIDSPSFAKTVIKKLKKTAQGKLLINNGLRFFHVVAPQVWAWGAKRAKQYAKIFDKLYTFFDFEVPYFTKYGLDARAVGHPIADVVNNNRSSLQNMTEDKVITFIPGSRMSEVKKLMPIFEQTINLLSACGYNYKYVIPTVETTDEYVTNCVSGWKNKPDIVSADKRYNVYSNTYIAVAASGTVSVELAMLHIPTVVVYKMNVITMLIIRMIIKVKWVSLINILLNKTVYPELLGNKCNVENIVKAISDFGLPGNRKHVIDVISRADNLWIQGNKKPSLIIADDIKTFLSC